MMTDYITPERLRELDACEDQVELFEQWLDSKGWTRARPTVQNLQDAAAYGLNVWWVVSRGIVSRAAALRDPKWAYEYARYVDQGPRDDTRAAALQDPKWAYLFARDVDKGPRADTRDAVLSIPAWAYLYARHVDKGPRDDTRAAVENYDYWAYKYERYFYGGKR